MPIEWERLDQPTFDRIVESLIHRLYSEQYEVQVIDGRGGDAGRDIVAIDDHSRTSIFQLKFFPEGFSSTWTGRRRQIKNSFQRALAHEPYEWILVVPCKLTPGERTYINDVTAESKIRVRIMDKPELDSSIARFSDLVSYYTRDDQLLEAAKIYRQETAMLEDGMSDIVKRTSALGRIIDARDPDWTIDFSRRGNYVVNTLRPKHAKAQEVSPVSIHLDASVSDDNSDLTTALTRSLGFGTDETVTLPPEYVRKLTISGPEWLSAEHHNVEVKWVSLPNSHLSDKSAALSFKDKTGSIVASYQGRIQHAGAGNNGYSLRVAFHNVATITFFMPRTAEDTGRLDFSFDVDGASTEEASRATAIGRNLHSECTAEIYVETKHLASFNLKAIDPIERSARLREIDELEQFTSDLGVVQQYCNIFFPIPTELPGLERIALRMARLVIDGHCVEYPQTRILNCTLSGQNGPAIRQLLRGTPGGIRNDIPELTVRIAAHDLTIRDVCIFHPKILVHDAQDALDALEAGTAAGRVVRLEPDDEENFRIYIPTRWSGGESLALTPLGLST